MIAKGTKVDEWIEQLNVDVKSGVYAYWKSLDKQILINAKCKGNISIKELFMDAFDPAVVILPVSARKEENLVVIKEFQ